MKKYMPSRNVVHSFHQFHISNIFHELRIGQLSCPKSLTNGDIRIRSTWPTQSSNGVGRQHGRHSPWLVGWIVPGWRRGLDACLAMLYELYSLLHALTSLNLASLVKYFTIGTHSYCLSEWESLSNIRSIVFLHKVKIIHTTRGQTK